MGRYATSMELHILRQDEDRPDGPEDSSDRTTNECVSQFSRVCRTCDMYADTPDPLKNRQTMAEVMLEGYGFGGVYVAIQAVLALYAQGSCPTIQSDDNDRLILDRSQ